MSLSKSSKENYHLDRKSKAMVIQAIKEIEIKEGGKKRSNREIAAILGPKLGRKISHTTVGKLKKKHELIEKQPEYLDNSDRWRYRKNILEIIFLNMKMKLTILRPTMPTVKTTIPSQIQALILS